MSLILSNDRDRELVEKFLKSIMPLSPKRIEKHRTIIAKVTERWLRKPLEEVTRDDLNEVWQEIHGMEVGPERRQATDWTKSDYCFVMKRFFRWLQGDEFVNGLKIGRPGATVGPEDILADEELSAMRRACHSVRDKALCETLYETALRPHEFLGLRKSDVAFDEYGAVVYVRRGKTGPRRVRVVNAAPLLANLVANHPHGERDSPLWIEASHNVTALKWTGLTKVVRRLTREAKIEKNVTPYIFRHTRLTHLARFLMEAELCIFAGWRIGSKMPRTYIHLSGRDVDEKLLDAYGIKRRGDQAIKGLIAPRKCPRCSAVNPAEGETCIHCGMALTIQAALSDGETEKAKRLATELLRAGLSAPAARAVLGKVHPDIGDAALDSLLQASSAKADEAEDGDGVP